MAQMQQAKVGSRKKGRRSAHMKPYYQNYRTRYSGKLIRRRAQREKQIAFFVANPTAGSPSQVYMRARVARRKVKRDAKRALDS